MKMNDHGVGPQGPASLDVVYGHGHGRQPGPGGTEQGKGTVTVFDYTVGSYLATRFEQIGLKHYFMVPGDYNLVLLDEFL
jgi:hypothetical protein